MPHPYAPLIPDFADLHALREENEYLRARLAHLTHLDLECAHHGLRDIAEVARKYIPAEHQETALYLLRLAYTRGRCDEMERGGAPVVVLRACPVCLGKGEG